MYFKSVFLAAISAALTAVVMGQNPPPATQPSVALPAESLSGVTLRALPAVLDARERRKDWHEAAQQAASRIGEPSLREQFNQRISGLVPKIASALVAQPQDDGLVTCAVYRDGEGKQAMVAVTFEGLGSQVGVSFFADTLSGKLVAPQGQGIAASLALDPDATSYLVFFVDHRKLDAGDVPQRAMAQSIVLAAQRQRGTARRENTRGSATAPPVQQPPSVPPDVGAQQAGAYQPGVSPFYPDVNDGYYYPAIGVPIVIVPGEDANAAGMRDRQRQREQELERQFQSRRNNASIQNHSVSPTTQNASTSAGAGNAAAQGPGTAHQPPNTAAQPPNTAKQPPNTAQQPPNTARQPPNTAQPPPNTAKQPPNTAKQPPNTANQPPNTAKPPPNTAKQPPNTASPPPAAPPSSPPATGGQNSPPPTQGK